MKDNKREIMLTEINKDIEARFWPDIVVGNTHEIIEETASGYTVNFLLSPGLSRSDQYYKSLFIKKDWIK